MNMLSFLATAVLISAVFDDSAAAFGERRDKSEVHSLPGPLYYGSWNYNGQRLHIPFFSSHTQIDGQLQDGLLDQPDILDKIVGGQQASPGEFPWQASVHIAINGGKTGFCGAAILNEFWLLGAAHCFEFPYVAITVKVGNYHLKQADYGEQSFYVERVVSHHKYVGGGSDFDNDIALIKIHPAANGRGIQFNQNVKSASLPEYSTSIPEGTRCVVSGWGRIGLGKPRPDILRKVEIPVANQQVCQRMYQSFWVPYIPQHMFCAGHQSGGSGSCHGDSGGGVICGHKGSNTVYGVVSWGNGCESTGQHGVYTFVPVYVGWIKSIIGTN